MSAHPTRDAEWRGETLWRVIVLVGVSIALVGAVIGAGAIVPWLSGGLSPAMPLTALVIVIVGAAIAVTGAVALSHHARSSRTRR